ncbi:lasso RiPP family leader peptide-containing protein [Candidatus Binatus sp.]|uniref:lasso RiPP family leader peptide-containing protein n=1 Tax=Candidatus Binatus sp. TaxID=2811406 RepID=UPI0039C880A3
MTKSREQPAKKKEERAKRRYARPRLIKYGSVSKLTASGGSALPVDGSSIRKPGP